MNAGIRDAFNLGWKLAPVARSHRFDHCSTPTNATQTPRARDAQAFGNHRLRRDVPRLVLSQGARRLPRHRAPRPRPARIHRRNALQTQASYRDGFVHNGRARHLTGKLAPNPIVVDEHNIHAASTTSSATASPLVVGASAVPSARGNLADVSGVRTTARATLLGRVHRVAGIQAGCITVTTPAAFARTRAPAKTPTSSFAPTA